MDAPTPAACVRRLLITFVVVVLALSACHLRQRELAAYAPLASNGCGRWGGGWLVPELWFTGACEAHDLCLQQGEPAAWCAEAFYQDMRSACTGRGAVCEVAAGVYAWVAGRR